MITVYAYVVADILHPGHVRYLQAARALGDFLIVGVLSAPATMEKKGRPYMSHYHRIEVVSALQCVSQVVKQDTYSPLENVKRFKPHILVESESHKEQPANDYVKSYGGKVVVLPYTHEISTTKIKERIVNAAKKRKHS